MAAPERHAYLHEGRTIYEWDQSLRWVLAAAWAMVCLGACLLGAWKCLRAVGERCAVRGWAAGWAAAAALAAAVAAAPALPADAHSFILQSGLHYSCPALLAAR